MTNDVKRAAVGMTGVAVAALLGLVPAGALGQCCGDCNGDGVVQVDELVTAVKRALTNCLPSQATTRVSVDSAGNGGNNFSTAPWINGDGRYVAFISDADNLVAGDTNGFRDMFVHDRLTGRTTRVSVDSAGNEGNGFSYRVSISADGRYVAFSSEASNLVPEDTNEDSDVFVHDRQTGQTTRVSVDSAGNQGNGNNSTGTPWVSGDGRYVAFASDATNLVPADTNGYRDVFVHDRLTGQTTRVSVDSAGNQGNGSSTATASISEDGRYVVFASDATNLVPDDTNGFDDVFVHDRQTSQTTRVSVDSAGNQGNGRILLNPVISLDGRYVVFASGATDLVPDDTNGFDDVFVHDRLTGQTTRVSVDSARNQGNGISTSSSISEHGRYVAFASDATNLVPDDTNGSRDTFVHDRRTGKTTRASVDSAGNEANGDSQSTSISADGRYVAYNSEASNLAPADANGVSDAFVRQLP